MSDADRYRIELERVFQEVDARKKRADALKQHERAVFLTEVLPGLAKLKAFQNPETLEANLRTLLIAVFGPEDSEPDS
jgi:hypothetical protein